MYHQHPAFSVPNLASSCHGSHLLCYHAEFIPLLSTLCPTIYGLESSLLEDMAPLVIQFYLFVNLMLVLLKQVQCEPVNLLPQSPEVILFKVKFKTVLWFSILLYLHLTSLLLDFFNGPLIRRIKRNFNSLFGYLPFSSDHSTSSKDMSQSLLLLDLLLSLNLKKKKRKILIFQ